MAADRPFVGDRRIKSVPGLGAAHLPPARGLSLRRFRPPIVGMARKRNESETVLHDRRRIRELFALGMGPTEISRAVGCARATVYRAIAPDAALDYCRRSALGEQVERVEEILAVYPLMPAPAIASVVGWTGSLRRLQQVVHPRRRVALQRARDMGSYPMAQPVKCEGM